MILASVRRHGQWFVWSSLAPSPPLEARTAVMSTPRHRIGSRPIATNASNDHHGRELLKDIGFG
jgi:hypothetical protein